MAVLTKGTQVYFIDPVNHAVIELYCVKTLNPGGAQRDQIETTCLSANSRSYLPGLPTPGQASLEIDFDPSQSSHKRFHELYVSGDTIHFAVGWSDGTVTPHANTSGDFVLPTSRSWLHFDGFIRDCPFNFAVNAVVASAVSIQVSAFPDLFVKS